MRRISVWALLPATLFALGAGTLIGRAITDDGGTPAATSKPHTTATVLGQQFTREDTTTTTEAPSSATTAVSVQVQTASPTTAPTTTPTTARPAGTTATTAATAASDCGTGGASASAKILVDGTGSPSDPTFTYSGPVTVANNNTKAIQIDSLVLRITSSDGTVEEMAVSGAAGTVLESGVTKDFSFSFTTKHPPRDEGGIDIAAFSYRAPGSSRTCARA